MSQSIVVVGATGTVGSQLIAQLAATGRRVKGLVRDEDKAASISEVADPVIGDLAEPASLAAAFEGADRVFVLAPPVPDQEMLTTNALEAASSAGVERIVYLSGYGVGELDDDHFNAMAAAEGRLRELAVEWTVLRPARFMSHTPFVWSSVLKRNLLLEAGGEAPIVVVDPADVAAAALVALTTDGHNGQVYKLTSGESFNARWLADTLADALGGRDMEIFAGNTEALRLELIASGAPGEYAPFMANYFSNVVSGFWQITDTVERLTGRPPSTYTDWLHLNLPGVVAAGVGPTG